MAANSITASEAKRLYKRQAPTHGRSKQHKEDLETISKASSPVAKAETLIAQRRTHSIDKRIEEMLQDHQGPRRKRYTYNQEAVIGLEHLVDGPLDPITQHPIWQGMLTKTAKGATLSKPEFYSGARSILKQKSMYEPVTMAER
jgi:hypothetical protein